MGVVDTIYPIHFRLGLLSVVCGYTASTAGEAKLPHTVEAVSHMSVATIHIYHYDFIPPYYVNDKGEHFGPLIGLSKGIIKVLSGRC